MLERAIELDRDRKAVYIIAANKNHASLLLTMLGKMYPEGVVSETAMEVGGIKIETPDSVMNFDWERMRLQGAHPNCVFLVDHYAIESRFGLMLRHLTMFDLPC